MYNIVTTLTIVHTTWSWQAVGLWKSSMHLSILYYLCRSLSWPMWFSLISHNAKFLHSSTKAGCLDSPFCSQTSLSCSNIVCPHGSFFLSLSNANTAAFTSNHTQQIVATSYPDEFTLRPHVWTWAHPCLQWQSVYQWLWLPLNKVWKGISVLDHLWWRREIWHQRIEKKM